MTTIFKVWEDILFAAEATHEEGSIFTTIRVWELMGVESSPKPGTPLYCKDPGYTENRDEAELYLHGDIKWDGCSNFHFDEQDRCMLHFCGLHSALELGTLLGRLYELAGEAMPEHVHEFLPDRKTFAPFKRGSAGVIEQVQGASGDQGS